MNFNLVFIAHDNMGSLTIFKEIFKNFKNINFLVVITTGVYYRKTFLQSVIKILKEASFRFSLNRYIEMKKYQLKGDTLLKFCKENSIIKYVESNDVNSVKTEELIRNFSPDIILSTFTMHIVKNNIIKLSKLASIGCHPSMLPRYRGLETFFWMLANGEKNCGASVFFLNEKVDSGDVIFQKDFLIDDNETVESLYRKLTNEISMLLIIAINKIINKEEIEIIKSNDKGEYFPMPTSDAYRKFINRGLKWK